MAHQKSIIKLKGTIDDISFLKTEDGYLARKKTSITAAQIKNDPKFQRTRENMSEFGRAGKATKLLRNAFAMQLQSAKDSKLTSRLTSLMMKVVHADDTSARGERNVNHKGLRLLKNFDFNRHAELSATLFALTTPSIDRVTGQQEVIIPSFIPKMQIIPPGGSTHYQLFSAGAELDFEADRFTSQGSESAILPVDATPSAPVTLTNTVTPNSTDTLMLIFGIRFFQMVNGTAYTLNNGEFNALSIALVDVD